MILWEFGTVIVRSHTRPGAPDRDGCIHEIKHDGYRTLIVIDRGQVRAFTRNGNDWTRAYRRVVDACCKLKCGSA